MCLLSNNYVSRVRPAALSGQTDLSLSSILAMFNDISLNH